MRRARLIVYMLLTALPTRALAFDIGGSRTGLFAPVTAFFQAVIDFAFGPFGAAMVGIACFGALYAWNNAPQKAEWLGKSWRAAASAIGIFGIGMLIDYFRNLT